MAPTLRVGDNAGVNSEERRRRGPRFWIGLGLLLAGLALLAWIAWQLWGTNWQSRKTHERLIEELNSACAGGEELADSDKGPVIGIVRIPEFGKKYQVPLLEGTTDEVLAAGFGHLEDTQLMGERGNFVIAGHRVTHGEPLRDMPELEPGDEVIIDTCVKTYTYELTSGGEDLRVPFTAGWVLDRLPHNPSGGVEPKQVEGQKLLTLTTCAELFHTDDRLVAFGVLKSVAPRD